MPKQSCKRCGEPVTALFTIGLCDACINKIEVKLDALTSYEDEAGTKSAFQRDAEDRAAASPSYAKEYAAAKAEVSTADMIRRVCDEVREILLEKNRAYGDSALNPVRIFSSASPEEQLRVRIDDKLSRLARGHAAGEDVILDLIGYLVLLRVHSRMAS